MLRSFEFPDDEILFRVAEWEEWNYSALFKPKIIWEINYNKNMSY